MPDMAGHRKRCPRTDKDIPLEGMSDVRQSGGVTMEGAMGGEECRGCRFWKDHGVTGFGDCRRYAPRPKLSPAPKDDDDLIARPNLEARWPVTFEEDWCGEFKEKA
jgi:hypothetical protein